MGKATEKLEFSQRVNFEFIISSKNNGTKYMLIIGNSCEEICNSKPFVDTASPGRHCGVLFTINTTCFIKTNLGETLSSRTPKLFSSNLPVL